MQESTLYSIGHGNKSIESFLEELERYNIKYLVDIRSKPYSKVHTQYNQEQLKCSLNQKSIIYVFMGDLLGGLPKDESCYTNDRVDYSKLREKDYFKRGLERLVNAHNKKIRIAIMCSESDPAECHRSKLIGEELRKRGIILNHIIRKKNNLITIKDQMTVISKVAPYGIKNLFDEDEEFISRKKYNLNNKSILSKIFYLKNIIY